MSADWTHTFKLAFEILGAACFVLVWLFGLSQLVGIVQENAKPVEIDEADLRWAVRENATPDAHEGLAMTKPQAPQYSDLPERWCDGRDTWLPPLPESAYPPESTPLN